MAKKRKRTKRAATATRDHQAQATMADTGLKPAAKKAGKQKRTHGRHVLDSCLLVLTGLGIALTAYLTFVAWFGEHPAYCTEGSGCDVVQSSRWSQVFGVPLAFFGLVAYALLFRLIWRNLKRWRLAFGVAVVALGLSIYLTFVSALEIQAFCAYCLVSLALFVAIVVLLAMRKPEGALFAWSANLTGALGAAAIAVLAGHLYWSGVFDPSVGPEDPELQRLAVHLSESGAKFYGASWCPRCVEQKAIFAASAGRLPYVECSPQGRGGPQSTACIAASINDYPTWIIDGERYGGLQTLASLKSLSKFK